MKVIVAFLVVLLAALQYRLWFGNGSVQELWRVREEARATRAEVLQLRSRNQALRAEVADLKSGLDAIEERARTDLGMIDADETFYQFVRERDVVGRRVDDREESLASRGVVPEARDESADVVEEAAEERPAIVVDDVAEPSDATIDGAANDGVATDAPATGGATVPSGVGTGDPLPRATGRIQRDGN